MLERTFDGLRQQDLTDTTIIVVDDGSTIDYTDLRDSLSDLPVKWEFHSTVDECPDTYNVDGFNTPSHAWNYGLRRAFESGAEIAMLLGSDVILPENAVTTAVKQANGGGRIFVASVVDEKTRKTYCSSMRRFPMNWFIACRMDSINAIEGFDERFLEGIAFDDNDFMGRLFIEVGEILISDQITAVHQSHPTTAYSDGLRGWRINNDYIKKKWHTESTPFDHNGPPLSWDDKECAGEGVLLYRPKLSADMDDENVTHATHMKFFKKCEENRDLLRDIAIVVPVRPEDGINCQLSRRLSVWYGEGTGHQMLNDHMGGFIETTRANIAYTFLKHRTEKFLLMIDNDIEPPLDLPLMLALHDKPVVAAPCLTFSREHGPQVNFTIEDVDGKKRFPALRHTKIPNRGLIKAFHAGTGAMLIRRDVMEAFSFRDGDSPFYVPESKKMAGMATGVMMIGEDISFCNQIRAKGFDVMVDLEAHCGHRKTIVMKCEREHRDPTLDPSTWVLPRGSGQIIQSL